MANRKTYQDLSRTLWDCETNEVTMDVIKVGALQRIANALERNNTLIDQTHQIMLEKRKNTKLRKELNTLKKQK